MQLAATITTTITTSSPAVSRTYVYRGIIIINQQRVTVVIKTTRDRERKKDKNPDPFQNEQE